MGCGVSKPQSAADGPKGQAGQPDHSFSHKFTLTVTWGSETREFTVNVPSASPVGAELKKIVAEVNKTNPTFGLYVVRGVGDVMEIGQLCSVDATPSLHWHIYVNTKRLLTDDALQKPCQISPSDRIYFRHEMPDAVDLAQASQLSASAASGSPATSGVLSPAPQQKASVAAVVAPAAAAVAVSVGVKFLEAGLAGDAASISAMLAQDRTSLLFS